jgi:hypothetical protein
MEGFKSFKKVQCFKDGGSVQKEVNFTKRDRKIVDSADVAQDKKIVKKAFSIHDSQQHEEKTDLKGLKKGGRAKKDCGTVKKYKTGGGVKKMADGGGVLDTLKNNIMGTPAQNAAAKQKEAAYLKAKLAQKAAGANLGAGENMAMGLAGLGQTLQPAGPQGLPQAAPPAQGVPGAAGFKKGGKAKKACK